MLQYNLLIELLQSLHDDGVRAAQLSETDSEAFGPLQTILDTLTEFRDGGLDDFTTRIDSIFGLVSTISMVVGAGVFFLAPPPPPSRVWHLRGM